MTKTSKNSRVLIIDCGIAHAAGPGGAIHPTAKRCRDFLKDVLRICHRMGFSTGIAEEWHRHRSAFARKWLVSMSAKKKVVRLDTIERPDLRRALEKSSTQPKHQEAMLKDAHLLEAALDADLLVASLDDTVLALFRDAAVSGRTIANVGWVNPDRDFESVQEWLERGAPTEPQLQLKTESDGRRNSRKTAGKKTAK